MPGPSATDFWKTVRLKNSWTLYLAVFLAFASFALAWDVHEMGFRPVRQLVFTCIVTGIIATMYVVAFTGHRRWFPIVILIHVALSLSFSYFFINPFASPRSGQMVLVDSLRNRLSYSALAITVLVLFSYVLFMTFIIRQGRSYYHVHAEMALAQEIHTVLVPQISTRTSQFEFYGVSVPSGEVGGDLVDVAVNENRWLAYIADVSGHGVAPGVLMGMVKSAVRMRQRDDRPLATLLKDLNQVIFGLKKPEMFVTFAWVGHAGNGLEYAVAGHLPIFCYRAATGSVEEVTTENLPLGMFSDSQFASGKLTGQKGDIFSIITDGLTEARDGKGEEFGIDRFKEAFRRHASLSQPLSELSAAVLSDVRAKHVQDDDQTLLFIRCT